MAENMKNRALELPLKEKAPSAVKPKWQYPGAGWIKMNTDGFTDSVNGRGGAGIIIRDDQGAFLRAKCAQ